VMRAPWSSSRSSRGYRTVTAISYAAANSVTAKGTCACVWGDGWRRCWVPPRCWS
jgi:hypothetical protein